MKKYINIVIALFLLCSCESRNGKTEWNSIQLNTYYELAQLPEKLEVEIKYIINNVTKDNIIYIKKIDNETLEIHTGIIRGPLDGGGEIYLLKRRKGKLELFDDGAIRSWVS